MAGRAAAGGWRLLEIQSFRGYDSEELPAGWTVVGNEITKSRGVEDIMTKDQYANFELELEWKIGKAGNSGIFYRATKEYDHIYWSGTSISSRTTRTPIGQQVGASVGWRRRTGSTRGRATR